MTTEEFISELCKASGIDTEGIFGRGRKDGWLEAEDEIHKDRQITRKNVARICHMFLLKVRKISDMDINKADCLRDLYDCRVCANHIAQVYLRGIMDASDIRRGGGFLVFGPEGIDDDETNRRHIERLVSYKASSNS